MNRDMASGPIISWQKDGGTVETVSDFIFLGSKITADGECSHGIKRRLLLGRNAVATMVNKRVQNAVLGCNLKNDRMISAHFQGKPFNITVIQVYVPTSNAEEAEVERFYEDLQDLLNEHPKKMSFSLQGTGMQK